MKIINKLAELLYKKETRKSAEMEVKVSIRQVNGMTNIGVVWRKRPWWKLKSKSHK